MQYRGRNIDSNQSLLSALKQMDKIDRKLLLVFKESLFLGLLSIGDIQRAIINNVDLETPIINVTRKNIRFASVNSDLDDIRKMMLEYKMEMCPVLDTKKKTC